MIEIIVILGCLLPILMFAVAIFACELRIQYHENDTRRYPRYGQSEQMRTKGKSRIEKLRSDKET